MFSSHPVEQTSIFESHLFCCLQELSILISQKFFPSGKELSQTSVSLTLNSIDTHFDTSTTNSFKKHCGKGEIAHHWS